MSTRISRRNGLTLAALAAAVGASVLASPPASAADRTHFYVPKPDHGAIEQIAALTSQGAREDAALIRAMIDTPQAVWFEGGTPEQAEHGVRDTVARAAAKKSVPVLVVYNIPYRDCSQFSAGGASGTDEYLAWIEGFAAGIGNAEVMVILEPDGLGIIPWYTTINGELEWCQPSGGDASLAAARFTELNAAVDRIKEQPNAAVYLDGTHSGWLGVGDLSDRLIKAGVERADGFFVNVSNYQEQRKLEKYGTWTSQCLYLAEQRDWWNVAWCGSQYFPANPADFDTWVLTDQQYVQQYADAGLAMPPPSEMRHFVVDTSRNGLGPWTPPADHPPGDPQDWCNPPDRGLGLRPTTATYSPLIDAYLWVKIPGESDGECTRWAPGGGIDPVRGHADPPAGVWFPEQALELARLAQPPLD